MTLINAALCLAFASILGGATGFGAALIATPLMLLAGLSLADVVVINLAAGLVTRIAVTYRLRDQIDWRLVRALALGSIPGALLGALTISMLPARYLKPAAGLLVILCGALMAIPIRWKQNCRPSIVTQTTTGVVGGYLSTTTSLNGPPVVLLLSRFSPTTMPPMAFIGNLAGYFVVTGTFSLGILCLRDQIPHKILWPGLPIFVAAALIGNVGGLWVARRLPHRAFRVIVIALVIIAGAVTTLSS